MSEPRSFISDHFPRDLVVAAKTVLGLAAVAGGATLALLVLRDYAVRLERRRLLYIQRPPAIPVHQGTPVRDLPPDEHWSFGTSVRPRPANKTSLQARRAMMTRNHSLPSGMDFESMAKQHQRKFRILALDGGGVRGIIAAVVLRRLVKIFPNLLDDIDVVAGTSTGGLVALVLAAGYSPRQIVDLYRYNAPIMFEPFWGRKYNPFNSAYSDKMKLDVCKFYMGERTLGDLYKYVVITAFRLDGGPEEHGRNTFFPAGSWRPCLFSNLPLASGEVPPDNELTVVDAAMRTTAAPTYFPIYQNFADGACFSNSPAIPAIADVCSHYDDVSLDDVLCLSLGCGSVQNFVPLDDLEQGDWGLYGWSSIIVNLLADNSMATVMYAKLMLRNRYHRMDPALPHPIQLDDATQMDTLITFAENMDISETIEWIRLNGFSRKLKSDDDNDD